MVNAELAKDPAGTLKKIARVGVSRRGRDGGVGTRAAAQFRDLLRDAGLTGGPDAHLEFGTGRGTGQTAGLTA